MKVYVVSADGERRTIAEAFEYEGDGLPLVSMELPPCRCPQCLLRTRRLSERTAS